MEKYTFTSKDYKIAKLIKEASELPTEKLKEAINLSETEGIKNLFSLALKWKKMRNDRLHK